MGKKEHRGVGLVRVYLLEILIQKHRQNKSCRSSPAYIPILNNVIQETFDCFLGGGIGLPIFLPQM